MSRFLVWLLFLSISAQGPLAFASFTDLKNFFSGDNSPSCLAEIARYPIEGVTSWFLIGAGVGIAGGGESAKLLVNKKNLKGKSAARFAASHMARGAILVAGVVLAGKGLYETFSGQWDEAEYLLARAQLSEFTVQVVDELLTELENGHYGQSDRIAQMLYSLQYQLNGLNGERVTLEAMVADGLQQYNHYKRIELAFNFDQLLSPSSFTDGQADHCLDSEKSGEDLANEIKHQVKIFLLRELVIKNT